MRIAFVGFAFLTCDSAYLKHVWLCSRCSFGCNALTLKSDAKLDCREKRKVKMASNTA